MHMTARVVPQGYPRCPDIHNLSECNHLYDLTRHIWFDICEKGANVLGGKNERNVNKHILIVTMIVFTSAEVILMFHIQGNKWHITPNCSLVSYMYLPTLFECVKNKSQVHFGRKMKVKTL